MKINLNQVIRDLDDEVVNEGASAQDVVRILQAARVTRKGIEKVLELMADHIDLNSKEVQPHTVARFVSGALATPDKDADWEEADERIILARKIRKAEGAIELDKKDVERIEKAVGGTENSLFKSATRQILEAAKAADKEAGKNVAAPESVGGKKKAA